MKTKYYIIWIEGFWWKNGEKIKTLDSQDHTYTVRMMDALRVKEKDIPRVKELLKSQGVSDWAVDSPNTFVQTNYAPKGTIYGQVKSPYTSWYKGVRV